MGKRRAEEPEVIVIDEETDAEKKKGAKKRKNKEDAKKKTNFEKDKVKGDKEKKERKKAPKRTDADSPKDDIVWEDSEGPSQDIVDLTGTKISSVSIQADYECDRGDIFIYDDVSPVHKLIQDYR